MTASRLVPSATLCSVRAATLDVWYTLIYLSPTERRVLERRRWRTWTAPLLRAGLSRAEAGRAVSSLYRWAGAQERRGRTPPIPVQARELSRRAGREVPPEEISAELDRAARHARVRLADGVRPVLDRLADGGMHLGVVSNVRHESGSAARSILASVGLLDRMEATVLSCEHPWSKPRPEPFRLCLREMGLSAHTSAIHIGDLPFDLVGARRAGLAPVLFTGLHRWEAKRPTFRGVPRPLFRFARWSRLPSLLRHARPLPPGRRRNVGARHRTARPRAGGRGAR